MTDYSTPLYDEVNLVEDYPDTVPWCPEEDVAGVVPMVGAGMDSIVPKSHRLPRVAYGNFSAYAQNGTPFGPTNVGFPVNAVIVSNWTPQWAKVAGEWIPPFSSNGVIRIPSASSSASISWEAPPGFTQPATTSGALLKAVFCEEPLSPKAFTSLASATGSGATVSGDTVAGMVLTGEPPAVGAASGVMAVQDAVATTGVVTITGNATPAVGPLAVSGLDTVAMATIATGYTGSVTLTPQLSYDGGTTWVSAALQISDGTGPQGFSSTVVVTTVSHSWVTRCTGATHFRINSSGYSSGGTNPEVVATASPGWSGAGAWSIYTAQNAVDSANGNPATGSNRMAVATGVAATLSLNAVTGTGAGTSVDLGVCIANPVMEVLAAAVTTGFTIHLEGSLEGTNWFQLGTATVSANGTTVVTSQNAVAGDGPIPARFLRANVTARTDGTISAWVAGA